MGGTGGGVSHCGRHVWTWRGGMCGQEGLGGQKLAEEGALVWLRMSLSLWLGPHFLNGAAGWVGRGAMPDCCPDEPCGSAVRRTELPASRQCPRNEGNQRVYKGRVPPLTPPGSPKRRGFERSLRGMFPESGTPSRGCHCVASFFLDLREFVIFFFKMFCCPSPKF